MKPQDPTIFILAQGKGTRWSKEDRLRIAAPDLPANKQLLPVGGEPLVRRSMRLLREEGFSNTVVLVSEPELWHAAADYGETLALPDPGLDILDALVQLIPKEKRAVMLLGDVMFSRLALRRLAKFMGLTSSGVLARCEPSKITVKVADEVFGFWYDESFQPEALKRTQDMRKGGRPGKPWAIPFLAMPNFAQTVCFHAEPSPHLGSLIGAQGMANICDYTDDIDSPIEYRMFWAPMLACALADENP